MRFLRRPLAFALSMLILLGFLFSQASAAETEKRLTILFTHDTHDHFLPMPAERGGEYGGYTRLAALLKAERAAAQTPVVTLDAGDFSMGSLFQTIYTTDAPELRALGAMGYDVTTLGNHEFDYRARGLADMLRAAADSGDICPAIVQANYKPPESDAGTWQAWERYGISDYTVVERGGLRVAVFGVLGVDADECAPMSGMEFRAHRRGRQTGGGGDPSGGGCRFCDLPFPQRHRRERKGRGLRAGKGVIPGIDVIISGHTHSTTQTPIQTRWRTRSSPAASMPRTSGALTIRRGGEGEAVTVEDYRLIPVDETVPD
ncbi:MAG: metallophosphoesterase [Intestinimonas sp.]